VSSGPTGMLARRGLTGRALVLGVVLLVLVLMLAAPVQRYLANREAIAQAQQQREDTQRRVDELTELSRQWEDPAYIEQQARTRLQYVMPGDIVYQVVPEDADGSGGSAGSDGSAPPAPQQRTLPGDSWSERLWATVEGADGAP
jgi:cell division protein FtsB